MNNYYNKFQLNLIKIIIFSSYIYSQGEIGTRWIDVKGKSILEIEEILKKEVSELSSYSSESIEETKIKLQNENKNRTIEFNNNKVMLRTSLNQAIDKKNDLTIELNHLKDQLALNQSEVSALEQKMIDVDSSTALSKNLITEEKKRVEDELTKIPFYEVVIARIKDFPENASNVSDFDNAMNYEISKLAINKQLGIEIIKKTIIQDGTLSENEVTSTLKGRANSNLTLALKEIVDANTGRLSFNRYRYGLVTLFPFQEETVNLSKSNNFNSISIDVEVVKNFNDGIANDLVESEKDRLQIILNEKILKNGDSESQIERLARNSKRVIKTENDKIFRNNQAKLEYQEKINNLKPIIQDLMDQVFTSSNELTKSTDGYNISNKNYENHIFNESYVEVFTWEGYTSANESITDKYVEFAVESFHEFLTSVKSEYLKEKTVVSSDSYRDIKESKKTDVVLNKIKLLGKFAESKGRKMQLSIIIAYNFGFEFEKSNNSLLTSAFEQKLAKSNIALNQLNITSNSNKIDIKDAPLKSAEKNSNNNIELTSDPSGAKVISGDKTLGITPLKTNLSPGLHSIVIKKKGYNPSMNIIEIDDNGKLVNEEETHYDLKVEEKKSFNKYYLYGGVALAGSGFAIFLLNQGQNETNKKTGSISVTIELP